MFYQLESKQTNVKKTNLKNENLRLKCGVLCVRMNQVLAYFINEIDAL